MAKLLLRNLRKSYGDTQILHGVSMDIRNGEFVVIVGPSGCGKSTLLRMVAGLEQVTAGEIVIGDRIVNQLEPAERDIAMVFQNYALYPHMTVRQNMSYGLKILGMPNKLIDDRVKAVAENLELAALLDRKPRQLSGGQRQRVAMGRAIVREPQVFLFDEPLSNLDAKLRVQMRLELELLHQRLKTTSLYVTHDQVEAMTLADRMMVLNAGRIEQIGTPEEVYTRPASTFVASFIGQPPMNLLRVRRTADAGYAVDSVTGVSRSIHFSRTDMPECFVMGIRPEHLQVCAAELALLEASIRVVENLGADSFAYCDCNGQEIVIRLPAGMRAASGDKISVTSELQHIHFFDSETGKRIDA